MIRISNGLGTFAQHNIIEATGILDFEQARSGWEFNDILENDHANFTDHCELCNQAGLERNYVIKYPKTKRVLRVGSSCIRRFVLFKEISNQEDSNKFFDHQCKRYLSIKSLSQTLNGLFASSIEPSTVNNFRKNCAVILDCKIEEIKEKCLSSKDSWDILVHALKTNIPEEDFSKDQMDRVKRALFDPRNLPIIRPTIRKEKYDGIFKKKHRVRTTHTFSGAYQDPSKKYNSD